MSVSLGIYQTYFLGQLAARREKTSNCKYDRILFTPPDHVYYAKQEFYLFNFS